MEIDKKLLKIDPSYNFLRDDRMKEVWDSLFARAGIRMRECPICGRLPQWIFVNGKTHAIVCPECLEKGIVVFHQEDTQAEHNLFEWNKKAEIIEKENRKENEIKEIELLNLLNK